MLRELAGIFEVTGQGRARYERLCRIVADEGFTLNAPPKTRRTPRKEAQSPPLALLKRLHLYQDDYLRFAHDFQVPFDNIQAKQDLRMVKLQQKISGSWRSSEGTEAFLAVRSYLDMARNQGKNAFDALTRLFGGDPWLPVTT